MPATDTTKPPVDKRLEAAAAAMRRDHGPEHPRHQTWMEMATLFDRLAKLAPYWAEPYAEPFVPVIDAGVRVSVAYHHDDRNGSRVEHLDRYQDGYLAGQKFEAERWLNLMVDALALNRGEIGTDEFRRRTLAHAGRETSGEADQ